MLRKIGRHLSPHGRGIWDDKAVCDDEDDDDATAKIRRASEPVGLPSPLDASRSRPRESRFHRYASVPDDNVGRSPQNSPHRRLHSQGDSTPELPGSVDSLGLTLIHTYPEPFVDIIFVHGLGGASKKTWSWERKTQNFWPPWLSQEAELTRSRIFTFGYNAEFSGRDTPLNILDFAMQLLTRMKTYSNPRSLDDQPIGTYPLIFVMHSMGGLVVKKAYVIGKSDEMYAGIISKIHSMLFLATPHRGSGDADLLNTILRTTPGLSAKTYVRELAGGSTTLQDINQQFSTVCGGLQLYSLYETRPTFVGVGSMGVSKMIVDRESAVLGYPTEARSSLNADHHGMSKFLDINDPNYIQVRDILRFFVRTLKTIAPIEAFNNDQSVITPAQRKRIGELLAIHDNPAEDFEIIRDRILEGSCRWINGRSTYLEWKDGTRDDSKIFWLTGLPGVGKSVLSSYIIDELQQDPCVEHCASYFFKSEHQTKRTISQMLRTIAFQAALFYPSFRAKLLTLFESDEAALVRQTVTSLWEQLFQGIMFREAYSKPLFWVLDGLDEADHPQLLIKLFSKIKSRSPIRILIISRYMKELVPLFGKNMELIHEEITSSDTLEDITAYAKSIISSTLHADLVQDDICNKVLQKARGSFLWVALALSQLKDNWHTKNDIAQVLNDLPEGMEPLYIRMIHIISKQAPRPKAVASRILTWTVCAFRPLELAELEAALNPEFGELTNLRDTISEVCGNFVVVRKSRVALIHDTARHFLVQRTGDLPVTIDYRLGNEHIALTCLRFFMHHNKNWKRTFNQAYENQPSPTIAHVGRRFAGVFEQNPFLSYATTWWAYHVSLSPSHTDLISTVLEFLETTCLVWIHAVAMLGDMRAMTRAGQYLKLYVKRRNRKSSNESLISLTGNRDDELKNWAKDFIRVVGRFGNNLTQSPISIHSDVIPFCPRGSILRQMYGTTSRISVVGISTTGWDDCLARLTMGNDEYVFKVLCKGMYFLTLIGNGVLVVFHAESCGEARRIEHGEWISVVACSTALPWLVTAGTKTIRGWDINTGAEVFAVRKEYERRILALSFGANDTQLLIGYDDSTIQCFELQPLAERWSLILEDPDDSEPRCAQLISFSPDNHQVLIGFRGRPMLAWNLNAPTRRPQKFIRPEDRYGRSHDNWKAGTPETVVWRPGLNAVLIIYNDNTLFGVEHRGGRPKRDPRNRASRNGHKPGWKPSPDERPQRCSKYLDSTLAFSPDGQRIYDIRGSFCNVWEPDALIRPDDLEREELSSTHDTTFTEPISCFNEPGRAQITTIVCDAEDKFYCCGKDSGAVVLYDMKNGEKIRKVYGHSAVASVIEMAWSASCKFIASADDCGRVIAKVLRKPTAQQSTWAVYPLLDFRPGEAVSQLLFSASEEYLLVSSSSCDWVWSLKERKELCRSQHPPNKGMKWMNHPVLEDRLICIDYEELRTFFWNGLKQVRSTGLSDLSEHAENAIPATVGSELPEIQPLQLDRHRPREDGFTIERAVQIQPTQIIFEARPVSGSKKTHISRRRMILLYVTSSKAGKVQQEPIQSLSGQANRLIGSFHGHVVFLDQQHSFCSWDLRRGSIGIDRHFFLPKDWLSPSTLKLCTMTRHGTILCPKNGEVAIIRGAIKL